MPDRRDWQRGILRSLRPKDGRGLGTAWRAIETQISCAAAARRPQVGADCLRPGTACYHHDRWLSHERAPCTAQWMPTAVDPRDGPRCIGGRGRRFDDGVARSGPPTAPGRYLGGTSSDLEAARYLGSCTLVSIFWVEERNISLELGTFTIVPTSLGWGRASLYYRGRYCGTIACTCLVPVKPAQTAVWCKCLPCRGPLSHSAAPVSHSVAAPS